MAVHPKSGLPAPEDNLRYQRARENAARELTIVEKALNGEVDPKKNYGSELSDGGDTGTANASGAPDFVTALVHAEKARNLLKPYSAKSPEDRLNYLKSLLKIAICSAEIGPSETLLNTIIEASRAGEPLEAEFCLFEWADLFKEILKEVNESSRLYIVDGIEKHVRGIYSGREFEGQLSNPPLSQDLKLNHIASIFLLCFSNDRMLGATMPNEASEKDPFNSDDSSELNIKDLCENCLEILKEKKGDFARNLSAAFTSVLALNAFRRKSFQEAFGLLDKLRTDKTFNADIGTGSKTVDRFIRNAFLQARSRVYGASKDKNRLMQAAGDLQFLIASIAPGGDNLADVDGGFFDRKDSDFCDIQKANLLYRLGMLRLGIKDRDAVLLAKEDCLANLEKIVEKLEKPGKGAHEQPQSLLRSLDYKRIRLSLGVAKAEDKAIALVHSSAEFLNFFIHDRENEFKINRKIISTVIGDVVKVVNRLRLIRKNSVFGNDIIELVFKRVVLEIDWHKITHPIWSECSFNKKT
ncbi:MAG: hypothetical protein R3A13_12870 [Bdellovibrionota bacterium]